MLQIHTPEPRYWSLRCVPSHFGDLVKLACVTFVCGGKKVEETKNKKMTIKAKQEKETSGRSAEMGNGI